MAGDPSLYGRLKKHFQSSPTSMPLVVAELSLYEHPNLQLATEELLDQATTKLLGIVELDYEVTLSRLAVESFSKRFQEGPVEYSNFPLADETTLACVKRGLYLFQRDGKPLAMLVGPEKYSYPQKLKVEVMAADRAVAEKFLGQIVSLTHLGKVYRGKVLSLERDCHGGVNVKFHKLPTITRGDIILPAEIIERVERHTVNFSLQVSRLRQAGRHLKRGILLFGPPGTGKTLSAMYLASRMPERTVILITGGGMGSIETACQLARLLQPATVVLEDVDLIGTRREHQAIDANALLFELLNQMDGLADDADVLFILTTNRPDILEPALSARPGRIDQAIEIPLPDEECRARLIERYAQGLELKLKNPAQLLERTAGASAALIRELLRKAALLASIAEEASADGTLVVQDRHLDESLLELLLVGGEMTKSLLGSPGARSIPASNGKSRSAKPRKPARSARSAAKTARRT